MIAGFLITILQLYNFIVLARVLLSYFPNIDRSNPIVQAIYQVTEPVLAPIREFIQRQFPNAGMIDFSPIVLFLMIFLLIRIIAATF